MKKKTVWSLLLALAMTVTAIGASTAAFAAAPNQAEPQTLIATENEDAIWDQIEALEEKSDAVFQRNEALWDKVDEACNALPDDYDFENFDEAAFIRGMTTLTEAEKETLLNDIKELNELDAQMEKLYGQLPECDNMVFTTTFGDTAPDRVLTGEVGYGMVGLMTTVPNNVHTMSPFIDGLVESSANLGVVSVDEDMVRFTVFARSSVAYQATQIGVICSALANSFGFTFDSEGHVPGWAVNPNSKLTHIACEAYKHLTGTDMIVEPVHAGVECGAFAEKNPHLDMISVGPTLLDVHTPNETCKIEDVKITTELLIEILERIAK